MPYAYVLTKENFHFYIEDGKLQQQFLQPNFDF